MTMREKMALTLTEEFREMGRSFDGRQAEELIDAVLDAMREPGDMIAAAGAGELHDESLRTPEAEAAVAEDVWQAMIDAIKAGK